MPVCHAEDIRRISLMMPPGRIPRDIGKSTRNSMLLRMDNYVEHVRTVWAQSDLIDNPTIVNQWFAFSVGQGEVIPLTTVPDDQGYART